MSTTTDAQEDRRTWRNIKLIARLMYAVIAFIIAITMLFKHPAESFEHVAGNIVTFLNKLDVFFITRLWWNRNFYSWDLVEAILAAGWFTLIIIAGGAVMMYTILYQIDKADKAGNERYEQKLKEGRPWRVFYSIFLSGLAAIAIQYALIFLVMVLGAIAGLIAWVAALIAAVEVLIHLHDAAKSGWELKNVAKETKEELAKKTTR